MTEKSEGMGHNKVDNKERDPHAALYFAEGPRESVDLLQGLKLEEQRKLIKGALKEAVHGNMPSGAEIVEIAYEQGIIKPEEIVRFLMEALMNEFGEDQNLYTYLDEEGVRNEAREQRGATKVLWTLLGAHSFLGLTIKGLMDSESKRQNAHIFQDDLAQLEDLGSPNNILKRNKKGIFKWGNF